MHSFCFSEEIISSYLFNDDYHQDISSPPSNQYFYLHSTYMLFSFKHVQNTPKPLSGRHIYAIGLQFTNYVICLLQLNNFYI